MKTLKDNTFVLDYSKWRCGNTTLTKKNKLGTGFTQLLNTDGYMCCLGQFCNQLGVPKTKLKWVGHPKQLRMKVDYLIDSDDQSTQLTNKAVSINDEPSTSVELKITLLTKLFKEYGITLKVINKD